MKGLGFLAGSLLSVSLAMVSPVAFAGEVAAVSASEPKREIEPFNLVHRAYSGHFSRQGIPGFNHLTTAYKRGEIQAKDLVKTAIKQGRLSPDKLNDEAYLYSVRYQLQHLDGYHNDD